MSIDRVVDFFGPLLDRLEPAVNAIEKSDWLTRLTGLSTVTFLLLGTLFVVGAFAPKHIKADWILKVASILKKEGALALLIGSAILGPTATALLYKRSQREDLVAEEQNQEPIGIAGAVEVQEEAPPAPDVMKVGFIFKMRKPENIRGNADPEPLSPQELQVYLNTNEEYLLYVDFNNRSFIVSKERYFLLPSLCYEGDQVNMTRLQKHMRENHLDESLKNLVSADVVVMRRRELENGPRPARREEEVDGGGVAPIAPIPQGPVRAEPIFITREPTRGSGLSHEDLQNVAHEGEYFIYGNYRNEHFLVTSVMTIRLPVELFPKAQSGKQVDVDLLERHIQEMDRDFGQRLSVQQVKQRLD